MTLSTRRYLFFLSVLVFIVLSIPLLLYSFGYRFSIVELTFRKTGGIFIHAEPFGAKIKTGSHVKTTSFITGNAFIQNLRPGNHIVTVSKEGSQPWNKTILVYPQNVTEIYPLLMPIQPQRTVLDIASSSIFSSPKMKIELPKTLPTQLKNSATLIVPHSTEEHYYFILANDATFSRWNSNTNILQQLLQDIGGFTVSQQNIILWDTKTDLPYRTTLEATNATPLATTSATDITNTKIFESATALIFPSDAGLWILLNNSQNLRRVSEEYESDHILIADEYILWWNDKTINIYWTSPANSMPVFQNMRQETIYNTEKTIHAVIPYPKEPYIIFQEDNAIYTLELDGRGGTRNKHTLFEGINPIMHIPPGNENLYIFDNETFFTIKLP